MWRSLQHKKVGSVPRTGLPALQWGLCPQTLCWDKHPEPLACTLLLTCIFSSISKNSAD